MDKKIPIIILNYYEKYLKKNLENLGFTVIELQNNTRTHLKNDVYINLFASDNCNPELCKKFTGCSLVETTYGATQIDSLCIIDNGEKVIVNTNDCPFELSKESCLEIKKLYDHTDLLLVGYSGAGPYPQCFEMNEAEKLNAAENKKQQFLHQAEDYINLLEPKYFLPFAGRYTLGGKLSELNDFRGMPELDDSYTHFENSKNIDSTKSKCILLNSESIFDLETHTSSDKYKKINLKEKTDYIKNILSTKKLDYEYEPTPLKNEFTELFPLCYDRFESRRKRIGFTSNTLLLIEYFDDEYIQISCNGNGFTYKPSKELNLDQNFVMIKLDSKLLKQILGGPQFAHWNNAEIGSHLKFIRNPDKFERALYHCLSYFHS
jgi:UDP-MurNAc hydroxylase